MKVRSLLSAGLLLATASTTAAADEMDVSIACDDNTGANLQTAFSDFYGSGKAVLVVTVGSGGLCKIINQSYPITGAVSVFIHGAGNGGSTTFMPGATGAVFQVTSGAQFSIDNMTLESASHGAISVTDSTLLVDQMIFSGNQAPNGGAIVASNGVVTVKRSTFEGNGSSLDGGAIALTGGGSLSVSDSTFHSDQTLSSGIGDGGAISATGVPVTIDRVLFNANISRNNRGGALYVESASLTVRNSTFTGNQAVSGGAIATVAPGSNPILLNNLTLHGDSASTSGSELYVSGTITPSAYTITNTLVGGSCNGFTAAPTAHGSFESPGNTCLFNPATNHVSVADASLFLNALADNGGPTKTILPSTGSPLIDAGGNDCEIFDQRHLVRNVGPCDVGALEVGATLAVLPPSVAKAFLPNLIAPGVSTLVSLTLTNPNANPAALSAPLDDSLPSHMVIGGGAATTTCANGNVSAIAGFAIFELAAGAQIPANGSCVVNVCVTTDQAATYTNTIATGALQTDLGNNAAPASAMLTVTSDKIFSDGFDGVPGDCHAG